MEIPSPLQTATFVSSSISEGVKIIKRRFPNLTAEESARLAAEFTNMHYAHLLKVFYLNEDDDKPVGLGINGINGING